MEINDHEKNNNYDMLLITSLKLAINDDWKRVNLGEFSKFDDYCIDRQNKQS